MSRRRNDLPIMLLTNHRKGLMVGRRPGLNGFSLFVFWLVKNFESGKSFGLDDIEAIDAELHFCDKESIQQTIKMLKWMLKHWEEEK